MPDESNPRRVRPADLPPDIRARYEASKAEHAKIRAQFAHKPGIHELLTPEELANGAPFYFELRAFVKQLKDAREAAGLTLAQVAEQTGLAADDLAELESGMMTNPPYRLLGLYAVTVGRRVTLTADPLKPAVN
jgi:hypothetical protein